jgi:hypothetical protein
MPQTYKRHVIVAGAFKSSNSEDFTPVAYIGWEITSEMQGRRALISRERYFTFEEASDAAYSEAKTWIDRHAENLD